MNNSQNSHNSHNSHNSQNISHTQLYVVIKSFKARLPDELTVNEGDIIELISDDSEFDDGWYMGKNLTTNEVGLYPKIFTKIKKDEILNSSRPSLLRSRSRRTPQGGSPITPTAPNYFENFNNNNNSNNNSRANSRVNSNNNTPKGVNRYVNDIDQALKELKLDKSNSNFSTPTMNTNNFNNNNSINNSINNDNNNHNNNNNYNNNIIINNKSKDSLDPSNVQNWTPDQVCKYFSSIVDPSIAEKFVIHKISGNILLELELSYLKELDISSFGTRFEIYKEIEHLRELSGFNSNNSANINNNNNNSNHNSIPSNFSNPKFLNNSNNSVNNLNDYSVSNSNNNNNNKFNNTRNFTHSTANYDYSLSNDSNSSNSSLPTKVRSHTGTTSIPNSNRFSYNQSARPQSAIIDRQNRYSRSSPSPLIFPKNNNNGNKNENVFNSPRDSQFDLQDVYEEPSINDETSQIESSVEEEKNDDSDYNDDDIDDGSHDSSDDGDNESNPIPRLANSISNANSNIDNDNEQFASPRKAPQPPNYPSPVSNDPSRFGIRSPIQDRFSLLPKLSNNNTHSRNSSVGNASSIYVDTSPKNYRIHSRNNSENSNIDAIRLSNNNIMNNNNNKRMSSMLFNSINENDTTDQSKESTPTPAQMSEIQPMPILTPNGYKQQPNERRSVSAKEFAQIVKSKDLSKRIHSEAGALSTTHEKQQQPMQQQSLSNPSQTLNSKSTLKQKVVGRSNKAQTSAFQEGIRNITPAEAMKDADFSGYMFKRGSLSIGSWKRRFFTLHKTRLSYYINKNDTKEKGLIDITSHKVLPATEAEDKLSAVYAATAGYGRYCFKLVPPAPGSRKGLTFTQQKVHYFAVETKEEMRQWMSALMKATIELDDTVPAISSCQTPTIPLQKAQELMAIARENAKENFDNLQKMREEQNLNQNNEFDNKEKFENPRNTYLGSNNELSSSEDEKSQIITSRINGSATPSSSESTSVQRPKRISSISNKLSSSPLNGMSTPYLMTSGLVSPNVSQNQVSSNDTPARMASTKMYAPTVTRLDDDEPIQSPSNTLNASNSFSRRMLSLRKTSRD